MEVDENEELNDDLSQFHSSGGSNPAVPVSQISLQAFEQFRSKQYSQCIETLRRLQEYFGNDEDPRIQHNLALVRYCAGGCREPDQLLETLAQLERAQLQRQQQQQKAGGKTQDSEFEGEVDWIADEINSLQFNQAAIHFQLKRYSVATSILEQLFARVESIEETLRVNLCFLLLDSYCIHGQVEKTASITAQLEKLVANFAVEMKPLLHLYKARVHILNKSMKAAKREIKFAMGGGQSPSAIMLKSNLEFLRNNFSKATKLLNAVQKSNTGDKTLPALYYNDMGCIHYRLKKYNAALFYFSKALKENDALRPETSLPVFSRDKRAEIMYNNGLLLLLTGNPETAFQCFHEAASSYYKSPHLFLRVAECCLAIHIKSLHEETLKQKTDVVQAVLGSGASRRIVLPTTKLDSVEANTSSSSAQEKPWSLEYAVKCLRNVLFLCRSSDVPTHCQAEDLPLLTQAALVNLAYAYLCMNNPVQTLAAANELLAKTGEQPASAATKGAQQVQYAFLGRIYAAEALCMTGRSAEAVKHLNAALLNSEGAAVASANDPLVSPYQGYQKGGAAGGTWNSTTPQARAILLANLATVHALQDDLAQAQTLLGQALSCYPAAVSSTPFLLLAVYISLRQGNTEAALSLLKRGSFVPRPVGIATASQGATALPTAGTPQANTGTMFTQSQQQQQQQALYFGGDYAR